jgi:putative glutamine amidotransferase
VRRPAVGVTIENARKEVEVFRLREDYVRAVEAAGGLPLVLAPGPAEGAEAHAAELLDHVGALLLTGGADIDPSLYGEERHPEVKAVYPERDRFELALCREALRRDLPVLAICRGHQVLNVATGGTLVQDIPSQVPGARAHESDGERWETTHEVEILPATRLREILGKERVAVNSFHHQSVKQLGRDLVLSARSTDGVVEGIEMPRDRRRFVVGVQWHPESFWDHPPGFQPLFEALVQAADGRR